MTISSPYKQQGEVAITDKGGNRGFPCTRVLPMGASRCLTLASFHARGFLPFAIPFFCLKGIWYESGMAMAPSHTKQTIVVSEVSVRESFQHYLLLWRLVKAFDRCILKHLWHRLRSEDPQRKFCSHHWRCFFLGELPPILMVVMPSLKLWVAYKNQLKKSPINT